MTLIKQKIKETISSVLVSLIVSHYFIGYNCYFHIIILNIFSNFVQFVVFCIIFIIFCIIFLYRYHIFCYTCIIYLQPDILCHYQIKIKKSVKLICNKCIPKLSIKCNNNHCSMYTRLCIPAISTPLLMLQLCKMYLINLYYRKYICI